jgi:type IV secretory pathway VirB9-like protein
MEKNKQNGNKKDKIKEILLDEKQITETLQRAIREAVETHKRAGNPLATWKDGKAVWIETKNFECYVEFACA